MCSLVSAFTAREESVIHAFFLAPIYLLLVSSADHLFKQLGHSSGPAKLPCENVRSWSIIWVKFAAGEEGGLFFKRTFSVHNHLPAFGGYFIANFMLSFPHMFRLAQSPPELKTIWPIIEHPNNVTYILICIVDTQCWQVKTCEFM